jgi:hypothetical protein
MYDLYEDEGGSYPSDSYSSEWQRMYAVERMEALRRDERPQAAKLTRAGKTVIIAQIARYGRCTDAYLGTEFVIRKVFSTLEEAVAWINPSEDDDYVEFIFNLERDTPREPLRPVIDETDEIPF